MDTRTDIITRRPDQRMPGVPDGAPAPLNVPPALVDLTPEARGRIVHYIITSTLQGGAPPAAVAALYADLTGDERATRYADQRFLLRQLPPDWRLVEDHVVDLQGAARERSVDLPLAWRRANDVAIRSEDPLEQLARLAGTPRGGTTVPRSIFEDPEDLDALEGDMDEARHYVLEDRLPDLHDLDLPAQEQLRQFAIEERLEHGLPPIELSQLYHRLDLAGDERARQYLDRVYVDLNPPADWVDVQSEAGQLIGMAEARGRDAGRLFADQLRDSPGMAPLVALRLIAERLRLGVA